MPSLVSLFHRFKGSEFSILAIDIREPREKVKQFAHDAKIPFPVLLDREGRVARAYGIRGTPAHLLIDRNGNLIAYAMGAKDWDAKQSRDLIQYLLDDRE